MKHEPVVYLIFLALAVLAVVALVVRCRRIERSIRESAPWPQERQPESWIEYGEKDRKP